MFLPEFLKCCGKFVFVAALLMTLINRFVLRLVGICRIQIGQILLGIEEGIEGFEDLHDAKQKIVIFKPEAMLVNLNFWNGDAEAPKSDGQLSRQTDSFE